MRSSKSVNPLALFLLFNVNFSCACSCADSPVDERFEKYNYVISGIVIEQTLKRGVGGYHTSSKDLVQITLADRWDWKNDSSHLKYLNTYVSEASCGATLRIGDHHTFFVGESGHVTLCGGFLRTEDRKEFNKYKIKNALVPK